MSERPITVLKFGSSILRDEGDLPAVVGEVGALAAAGHRVVAVVSAMGGSTDDLLGRAGRICSNPDSSALSSLLATGEATSAALLAMALNRGGIPAAVLDPGRVGPVTRGPLLDAEPVSFNREITLSTLSNRPVAVMPGFVGRDRGGEFSLLGRGGSDLTALVVAHFLGAERCRLVKDVDGIYESDPSVGARNGCRRGHSDEGPAVAGGAQRRDPARPRRYELLSWDGALRLGAKVTQPKALEYARTHRLSFEVGAMGGVTDEAIGTAAARRTLVGPGPTLLEDLVPESYNDVPGR